MTCPFILRGQLEDQRYFFLRCTLPAHDDGLHVADVMVQSSRGPIPDADLGQWIVAEGS